MVLVGKLRLVDVLITTQTCDNRNLENKLQTAVIPAQVSSIMGDRSTSNAAGSVSQQQHQKDD